MLANSNHWQFFSCKKRHITCRNMLLIINFYRRRNMHFNAGLQNVNSTCLGWDLLCRFEAAQMLSPGVCVYHQPLKEKSYLYWVIYRTFWNICRRISTFVTQCPQTITLKRVEALSTRRKWAFLASCKARSIQWDNFPRPAPNSTKHLFDPSKPNLSKLPASEA